jgi:hypothetical protein
MTSIAWQPRTWTCALGRFWSKGSHPVAMIDNLRGLAEEQGGNGGIATGENRPTQGQPGFLYVRHLWDVSPKSDR